MRSLYCLLVLGLMGATSFSAMAQRESSDLLTNWKFIKQDAAPTASTDAWESISLPHTWNNLDGQDGKKAEPQFKDGYYRGPGWYARIIKVDPAWQSKRVFIRFEAAATVAQVYFNGKLLGEHRGNFTAFCYELTPYLHFSGPNELRVRVDNSKVDDVAPLSGDFDIMGGIYRPVHLIVTDPVCISPLDNASAGVYLTQKELSDAQATVEVRTVVSNGQTSPANAEVETQIVDANHQVVATQKDSLPLGESETKSLVQMVRLDKPHRWNGRKDPYLYTASVHVATKSEKGDEVAQSLGLRTVEITNDKGFLLNGQPYPIYGVNRHQDWRDKGWALSQADHDEDLRLMLDMGVTAIRLAHYPQSEYLHDQCDRNGILLWNEVSLVNEVRDTPEFKANASQQLHELILQRYNHPCVAFWGLFNELQKKMDPIAVPILTGLKAEALQLDSSRLIVAASCVPKMQFNTVPDWVCFNPYFGWYYGQPEDLTKYIADRYLDNDSKRIGISEYGAGANPFQHQEDPVTKPNQAGQFHPEEWQSYVHEKDWAQIRNNPDVWGSFIWCMFDFASDHRDEGGNPGVNDKGMVTEDRKVKKDVYYFYQANWSDKPMVHITGQRLTERKNPAMEVKVYSNCSRVELKLNGKSLGVVVPDEIYVCRWANVALQPGTNHVEAVAPGQHVSDSCDWTYTPAHP